MAKAPRIYDYALSRIVKRRRLISHDVLIGRGFYNRVLDAERFEELIAACGHILRLPKRCLPALRETLLPFLDKELTERQIETLTVKLAGGYKLLKEGKAIRPYTGVAEPTWVPVEIVSMRYGKPTRSGKTRCEMTVMIMAGAGAGAYVQQQISMKWITTLFATQLGWPKFAPRPRHTELVRMWFTAELINNNNSDTIAQFECAPHQVKYNKSLRKQRAEPCINGYRTQCYRCPIGYIRCERGTHRCDWIIKYCPGCQQESYFDPETIGSRVCLACSTRTVRRNWAVERKR